MKALDQLDLRSWIAAPRAAGLGIKTSDIWYQQVTDTLSVATWPANRVGSVVRYLSCFGLTTPPVSGPVKKFDLTSGRRWCFWQALGTILRAIPETSVALRPSA